MSTVSIERKVISEDDTMGKIIKKSINCSRNLTKFCFQTNSNLEHTK